MYGYFAIIRGPMEEIWIKKKKFTVVKVVANHPDHDSYIATYANVSYLVRVYREEYQKVLDDYKLLKHCGINMAKMNFHDDERQIIAFDAFHENDVLSELSKGPLPEEYFRALFALYRFARFSKIALDWAPQNFMLRGSQMFYLPIKVSKMDETNGLEKVGLASWFHGKELKEILKKKGYDVSGYQMMSDAEVNKSMALMAIKYWN